MGKKLKGGWSRGRTIHKKKSSARKIKEKAKSVGMDARLTKVKGGWRVDKKY